MFTENYTFDPSGFIGGVQGGLQATWGHWLLGVEGTYTWTGLSQTAVSSIAPNNLATMDVKYLGAVSARLGFTLDRLMVYAKAAGPLRAPTPLTATRRPASVPKPGTGTTAT